MPFLLVLSWLRFFIALFLADTRFASEGNRIYDLGVRAVEPRLPEILSTYGGKRFSHIEVGMGSGVSRLTRVPGLSFPLW